ncbi:hexokinase-1 [Sphaerulina musiva SO2202]|uniref:Phosphotransferase n=1 Tax=Sphaerulina musiva (strain SO2202) TaxID=692275 RepID=M3BV28_SPHMS|nr:hexokinase-1 [Sphaerulina musiva SO2202]EMF11174.1 hexokinase-1 [Sphaerulina musiva SO2202]
MTSSGLAVARYCLQVLSGLLHSVKLGKAMSAVMHSVVRVVHSTYTTKPRVGHHHVAPKRGLHDKSMDDFLQETRELFEADLQTDRLLAISTQLQTECWERLEKSAISMLPSYTHTLPTGHERGDFLALDVGGSTFRIALIRLSGKSKPGADGLQIRRIRSFAITEQIRGLEGQAFFDWMAERIGDMLGEYNHLNGTTNARLAMGLAWSFPIEQTSPRSGRLGAMGKGFKANQGVEGQDLSELIMRSCNARNLNVQMRAIINDSAGTLMSQAYRDPSTRMSLILGTGTNAGVFLPRKSLGTLKFGVRPESWYEQAERVLINTEFSMIGQHSLPKTRYDEKLNTNHSLPDFQPLEYQISGRYLGEIARLILVDAVEHAGLFGGHMPEGWEHAYSFDCKTLAAFESDPSRNLEKARSLFLQAHPLPSTPRTRDLELVRDVACLVSRRAAAHLATAMHALWTVRTEAEALTRSSAGVTIACNGTIIEKYPGFRQRCQTYLDDLCEQSGGSRGAVTLSMAPESSIFGAAVAVACMEAQA